MGEPGGKLKSSVSIFVLFTTTVSTSSFGGLPRKYCITFRFFSIFHLYCLSDHTAFYENDKEQLKPFETTAMPTELQERSSKPSVLAQFRESKNIPSCLKERWQLRQWPQAPSSCMQCWIQSYVQMVFGFFKPPHPSTEMQKWKQENQSGQIWGRVRELRKKADSPCPAPNSPAASEGSLWDSVKPPHRSHSYPSDLLNVPFYSGAGSHGVFFVESW